MEVCCRNAHLVSVVILNIILFGRKFFKIDNFESNYLRMCQDKSEVYAKPSNTGFII